ncbi:hypothetical protein BJV77DRAFT_1004783 [Russula vinacea]|nr:hypothetical protein BJV77DRAFT_1004783 [Russula vinacea]
MRPVSDYRYRGRLVCVVLMLAWAVADAQERKKTYHSTTNTLAREGSASRAPLGLTVSYMWVLRRTCECVRARVRGVRGAYEQCPGVGVVSKIVPSDSHLR